MPESVIYTPGMRLRIRDEEFSLLHADPLVTGGHRLLCLGISETVAGKEWEFVSELENPEILRPEETRLVADTSPHYRDSLLYVETHLRSRVTTGPQITLGHRAAMDAMNFQLEPARMALGQTRPRILIADTVGLGKTLEAGILVTELMARGRGKRILVVTVKSMLTQFQKEFWNRFTIPLVRMDSQGLARVRTRIPRNHNPFDYIEKSIISVDTLKNEDEYRVYLEKAFWDIIIIDEAHHVSYKGNGGKTLSYRLATLLGSRSDTLVLLSATPHNGKPESFASLMKMLDPTSIADPKTYNPEDIKGLFIRRFRKDVAHEMRQGLPERQVMTWAARASESEEAAYQALNALRFSALDGGKSAEQLAGGHMLKAVSLKKALLSSPMACLTQITNMVETLSEKPGPEAASDRAQLEDLAEKVALIGPENFSKYQHLLAQLRSEWNWNGKSSDDRLVIFTERIETLKFLERQLASDLKLPREAVRTMTGAMGDVEAQAIVEEFGKERSSIRLLIATDVASEGLNLHFQSHRLVHFDIPWSLMVFQQRNGRIDRYGQTREPLIAYLFSRYHADVMGGDVRVLEILIEKEKAAWKNIGDPATLMGQFDPEKEELYTADLLLDASRTEAFEKKPVEESGSDDFLSQLFSVWGGNTASATGAAPADLPLAADPATRQASDAPYGATASGRFQLFDDYAFLRAGLESVSNGEVSRLELTENPAQKALSFELDEDLESWLREQLPRELRPDNSRLELVGDPAVMIRKIRMSQAEEKAWPEADYLWSNHPVFTWLTDRIKAKQGRQQAPVLFVNDPDTDIAYLISSTYPNRRGRPVYQRLWTACKTGQGWKLLDGESWLAARGFTADPPVNDGLERDLSACIRSLPTAVNLVAEKGSPDFIAFRSRQKGDMDRRLAEMHLVRDRRNAQLDLSFAESNAPEQIKQARLREEREKIDSTFRDWMTWVEESMTVEDKPYLQVLAVFAKKER